jgi:Cof subfamily protein (haloacid dehalogenase superfamily)
MIKLIAIDLDGTLLNGAKEISEENKRVLKLAKAQGAEVVICTGRPLAAIRHYLQELGMEEDGDYSITFNGGLVQKNKSGEVLGRAALTYAEVLELATLAESLDLPLDIVMDEHVYQLPTSPDHKSGYNVLHNYLDFVPKTVADLNEEEAYNKTVSCYDAAYLDAQIPKIPQAFFEKFEIAKSRDILLEFLPKGVDKAYGMQILGDALGIKPEEMMAIGDEENDLPMIEFAGYGVAMGNAVPTVKAAANVLTADNEHDGVAEVVRKYVLK